MLLRRVRAHISNENWFAVFVDFLVVVVGLFIGFQIDTWWEGRKEARLENTYLLEIREDFETNKLLLEDSIGRLEEIIRGMQLLHEQSRLQSPTVPVSTLNINFKMIQHMPTFFPIRRTYSNLTGSGDLKLIQNRALKNLLADYYSAAQLAALVQETHERELVHIYEPYVIENMEYSVVAHVRVSDFAIPAQIDDAHILDVLKTREFRNIVAQKWVITSDVLNQHRTLLAGTKEIIAVLDTISEKND